MHSEKALYISSTLQAFHETCAVGHKICFTFYKTSVMAKLERKEGIINYT